MYEEDERRVEDDDVYVYVCVYAVAEALMFFIILFPQFLWFWFFCFGSLLFLSDTFDFSYLAEKQAVLY